MKNIKIKSRLKRTAYLLLSGLIIALTMFCVAMPKNMTAKAEVGTDVIKEGDYYRFSSKEATRFWLNIPLKDVKGNLNYNEKTKIKKENGFQKERTDYNCSVIIRLDDIKYKGYPIQMMSEVAINMAGTNTLFTVSDVTFKSDVRVDIFLSAFNYLTDYIKPDSVIKMTISVLMNQVSFAIYANVDFWGNKTGYAISGLSLDNEPYNPQEDIPTDDDFKLISGTDETAVPLLPKTDKTNFNLWEWIANFFSTTANTVKNYFTLGIIGLAVFIAVIIVLKIVKWAAK